MRRDFLFLAIGIPEKQFISDKKYFVAAVDEGAQKQFLELAKRLSEVQAFMSVCPTSSLFCVGIRNDHPDEQEAADHALATLGGIVDGYSLLVDASVPKVCSYFVVRTGDAPDVAIKAYCEGGWAHLHPKSGGSEKFWEEIKTKFSRRMLSLFDVAVRVHPRSHSPLAHQLLYSARMFRHGAESHVFGIQYLCKFSAMEGLVCGSETRKKEALLKERIGKLFRKSARSIEAEVEELWERRCAASHQAKAFPFEDVPESVSHARHIATLEYFFRGALVFALDGLDHSAKVEELWSKVNRYELPDYALAERPADMPRYAVERGLLDRHVVWRGAGLAFDKFYEP